MSEGDQQMSTLSRGLPNEKNNESDLSSSPTKIRQANPQKDYSQSKIIGVLIILIAVFYAVSSIYQVKNQTKNINKKLDRLTKQLKKGGQKNHSASQSNIFWVPSTGKLGANSKIIQKGGIIKRSNGTVFQIDFQKGDQEGRSIQDVLYSEQLIQKRTEFFERRNEVVSSKQAQLPQLALSKYNLKLTSQALEEDRKLQQAQYERVNKIYNFEEFESELPICLLVPGYNNNDKFRLESNLNSIFSQNYTNYFVAILDDASTDKSNQVFANYLNFYNVNPLRYVYLKNQRRLTSLQNIYYAVHNICSQDSIMMIVDGDDELIGNNVLKIFNVAYQKHKAGVVYSNFYFYNQDSGEVKSGFTTSYTDQQKDNNKYRQISPGKYSQLRSVRTSLFRKIEARDLQEQNGSFYKVDYDLAIFIPSMELSCSKVFKVEGVHYLYNINTGINDFAVNNKEGARIQKRIRESKSYICDQDFKEFISRN